VRATPEARSPIDRVAAVCARAAEARWFQTTVVTAILANAVVLGLETYDGLMAEYGTLLESLDKAFLVLFVIELVIRIAAYGRRPQDFFRSGWNVFDFCVIGAVFVPGLSANATALRLIRLLRVVRLVSVVPDMRVLLSGLARSAAPIGTMMLLVVFLMYVYAIVGWVLFADVDPEQWGDVGRAMLTLFSILTLEGWIEVADTAAREGPWVWIYFISFILIGTFVVLNLVIGVLINSLEEAREEARAEREEERRREAAAQGTLGLEDRVRALRDALDDLERELIDRRPPGGPPRPG
jgi:voltage-gated sodium channel